MNRIHAGLAVALLLATPTLTTAQEKTATTSTGIELVWIPPGEFLMGSTQAEQAWAIANESLAGYTRMEGQAPRLTKIANGFWLARTELTVDQWKPFATATSYVTDAEKVGECRAVSRAGGLEMVKGASWKNSKSGLLKHNDPVSCVSWNDAVAFCHWLTATEQKAKKLPAGMVCRLPTEAEWEYACRAGTQTKFWWGDKPQEWERRANLTVPGKKRLFEYWAPVGSYHTHGRNKFGLVDMIGNVWEWCLDAFDKTQAHEEYYKGNPDEIRVIRGGAFTSHLGDARCATRLADQPTYASCDVGFRVAIGPER